MKITRTKLLKLGSIFLLGAMLNLTVATNSAYALSTDRDQPAEIEADDIEFDLKKGTRTYTNNVIVIQGTLNIKADKLHAIYKNGALDTVTAWGSLARFKQRPDGKPHDVQGWAKKIIVNETANTLTLIGKAALKQGPDTARGDTIVYNMANDTLKLKGGAKVGAAGKDGSKPPARKLKDPFAEPQPAPKAKTKKSNGNEKSNKKGKNGKKGKNKKSDEDQVEETKVEKPEPLKKGRSRLIIQPK